MQIRIDVRDGINLTTAMDRVQCVILYGKRSKAAGIDHYCWVTVFPDGTRVTTRHKKKDESADSFIVEQDVFDTISSTPVT